MSNKLLRKISRAFDNCLQVKDKEDAQLEDCLNEHPQHKNELTELLDLTNALKALKDVNPSEKFSKNANQRITQALVDQPVTFSEHIGHIFTKKPYRSNRRFSMSQFLLTLILAISLATGGVYAADSAGPGDLLYGLDRAIDQFKLVLISNPEIIVSTRLQYAAARLEEAINKIEYGQLDNAIVALEAYDREIDQLDKFVASREGLDHDILAAMLEESLAVHHEVLTALLDQVPEEAREAILHALQVSLKDLDIPIGPPTDLDPAPPIDLPTDLPITPPQDINPTPPVEIPPIPTEDIPPVSPTETPPDPPEDMLPTPPVEIPPIPTGDIPPIPPIETPPPLP